MTLELEKLDMSKLKKAVLRVGFQSALEVRDLMLIRYSGGTRKLYQYDIDLWLDWCFTYKLNPMGINRHNFESFGVFLMEERNNSSRSAARRMTTIRTFYRSAMADLIIMRDPTFMARMPKWSIDPDCIPSLSRSQVFRLLRVAENRSPSHHAFIALLAMLGLRVSEACNLRIEDYHTDGVGYSYLRVLRKGGKYVETPVPLPLATILRVVIGDRSSGPIITRRNGLAQDRRGAYDWFKRLAKAANLPDEVHPHTLRHAAITALIESGEPIHRVQEFACHKDIRTTEHYYRRKPTYEAHGSHVAARLFAYES